MRSGHAYSGKFVGPIADKLMYEQMASALLNNYLANGKKSLVRTKRGEYVPGEPHLRKFFAGFRAVDITATKIDEFIYKRREEGASAGTINRSLAALKRMFVLALKARRLRATDIPEFDALEEHNTRKGFLERDQYFRLRDALPDYLKPVVVMAYYTGMRRGEILPLRPDQINLLDGQVRLDPGTTKNDEAREISLTGELKEVLRMQLLILSAKWPECQYVFFRNGKKIGNFRKAWIKACISAGLGRMERTEEGTLEYVGLIFHDLRRTAVRNLVRAGVSEKVAMEISGHRTREIFDRYNIVSGRDLTEAAHKLDKYFEEKKHNTSTMTPEGDAPSQLTN